MAFHSTSPKDTLPKREKESEASPNPSSVSPGAAIRDWVDNCLVPILVRQYLAERKSGEGRASGREAMTNPAPCHPEQIVIQKLLDKP